MLSADRVLETSTTTGTGNFTLAGATTGYQSFNTAFSTGATNAFHYAIVAVDGSGVPTGDWETGVGYLSASTTLVRNSILASSNSGSAVNFSSGTKNVFGDFPAAAAGSVSDITTITLRQGTMYLVTNGFNSGYIGLRPVWLNKGITISGVKIFCSASATTNISGGLYDDSNGTLSHYPGAVLADGGASPLSSVSAGINTLPFTTPYTITADGWYYYGFNNRGAAITTYLQFGSLKVYFASSSDTWSSAPTSGYTWDSNANLFWGY